MHLFKGLLLTEVNAWSWLQVVILVYDAIQNKTWAAVANSEQQIKTIKPQHNQIASSRQWCDGLFSQTDLLESFFNNFLKIDVSFWTQERHVKVYWSWKIVLY